MIIPKRLCKGDTIGVVAPASPPNKKHLKAGISFFENMGLKVKVGAHVENIYGYLAGTDEERLADFHKMIADPTIKAIIFARGGYGTGRIAPFIDYKLMKDNPKIIWGFSDITYLHTAIRQATGLVTFHGPMVVSAGKVEFDMRSAGMFRQLFEPVKLCYSEQISPLQILSPGTAVGPLAGGNLSLIISGIGTNYELDTKGKILLLEDVGEEPYEVDSMLNQLKLAGKLRDLAGIVVGDFADAKPEEDPSLTLEQVLNHYLSDLNIPVMTGFKIGHCSPHFSVPLGVEAVMSTADKTLFIDAGVK